MYIENHNPEYSKEEITSYIVNRNIDNTMITTLNITLNKVNNEWFIVKDVNIRESIAGSSIPYENILEEVFDNYESWLRIFEDLYNHGSTDLTLDEYMRKECIKFIDNYIEDYIDFNPFEEAFDVEN